MKRVFTGHVARPRDDFGEPLLPTATATATAPDIRYAVAVEVDPAGNEKYSVAGRPAVGKAIQPNRIQLHRPGMHEIADEQSRRIEREMMRGERDGDAILRDEHVGYEESASNASQMSTGIKRAIQSSFVNDDLDPYYEQQRQHVIDPIVLSKEEKLAEEDGNYERTVPKPEGYKVAEYKCIYEEGGKTFYEEDHDGYKVHEYKSEYNV